MTTYLNMQQVVAIIDKSTSLTVITTSGIYILNGDRKYLTAILEAANSTGFTGSLAIPDQISFARPPE